MTATATHGSLSWVGDASVPQTNEDSASSLAVRRIAPAFVELRRVSLCYGEDAVLILARRRVETGLFPTYLLEMNDVALKSISSTQFARFAAHCLEHAHEFFRKYRGGDRQIAGAQLAENQVCVWDVAVVDIARH